MAEPPFQAVALVPLRSAERPLGLALLYYWPHASLPTPDLLSHLSLLARVLAGPLEATAAREATTDAARLRTLSRASASAMVSVLTRLSLGALRRQPLAIDDLLVPAARARGSGWKWSRGPPPSRATPPCSASPSPPSSTAAKRPLSIGARLPVIRVRGRRPRLRRPDPRHERCPWGRAPRRRGSRPGYDDDAEMSAVNAILAQHGSYFVAPEGEVARHPLHPAVRRPVAPDGRPHSRAGPGPLPAGAAPRAVGRVGPGSLGPALRPPRLERPAHRGGRHPAHRARGGEPGAGGRLRPRRVPRGRAALRAQGGRAAGVDLSRALGRPGRAPVRARPRLLRPGRDGHRAGRQVGRVALLRPGGGCLVPRRRSPAAHPRCRARGPRLRPRHDGVVDQPGPLAAPGRGPVPERGPLVLGAGRGRRSRPGRDLGRPRRPAPGPGPGRAPRRRGTRGRAGPRLRRPLAACASPDDPLGPAARPLRARLPVVGLRLALPTTASRERSAVLPPPGAKGSSACSSRPARACSGSRRWQRWPRSASGVRFGEAIAPSGTWPRPSAWPFSPTSSSWGAGASGTGASAGGRAS